MEMIAAPPADAAAGGKKNAPLRLAAGRWQRADKLFFLAGEAGLLQGVKHGLVIEIAGHFK
jgi:hypothetical protein